MPYENGNEIIYIDNPEFPSGLEIKDKIELSEKTEQINSGNWNERYSGYTITVYFEIQKNWIPNEELLNSSVEESIGIYQVYIDNNGRYIYLIDKNNEVLYITLITPIKEMGIEQKIEKMREYLILMIEEK